MRKQQKKTRHDQRARPAAPRSSVGRLALSSRQRSFIFVCTALVVSACLHLSSNRFADPDDFYHFRHAEIYGSAGLEGVFRTTFPWVRYSMISKFSADLWYGFHILIMPFTWLDNPLVGMRLTGIFLTFAFLVVFYVSCVTLKIKAAFFWPFFLLFSSPFLLHRLGMLRPQVLSLGLSTLLFALLANQRLWGVFFAALASTFLHLNLFFMSFMVFGIFALIKLWNEKSIAWRECLILTAGILCGWLLRPNPLGAAQILYVQLFQFTLEKAAGTALDLGAELLPLKFKPNSNYLLFTAVLLFTFLYFLWRLFKKDRVISNLDRTVLLTSAVLTFICFVMSVLFARRAFDFCSGFGVILISLVFSRYLYEKWVARAILFFVFVILVPYGINLRNQVLSVGWDSHRFESAAKWISDHSNPGDIVFNARWEYFPELFFWNTKNIYSTGMDPIFQYAYDPVLYWESNYLTTGSRRELACPETRCDERKLTDPYRILKEDFKARYVVLAKPFDGSLYFRLLPDSRFSLRQENDTSAVFEVN